MDIGTLDPIRPARPVFDWFFDREVRSRYFRGLSFDSPPGDPGWFGPGSAVWHVHGHWPTLVLGLNCAAYIEGLDPSIWWMGVDHSRIQGPDRSGEHLSIDPEGAAVRFGHSLSFFIGTAYGSTETAERVARSVRAMHHTVKGTRPDGLAYEADDPDWLRWNYATVVWGLATAHERYHHRPLRGRALDRYYGDFTRVGHALGGTNLPTTKAETLDCLRDYLPRLAVTPGRAFTTGSNLRRQDQLVPVLGSAIDWIARDTLPAWAARMVFYRRPNPATLLGRRSLVWLAVNAAGAGVGPLREFRQAQARVAGGANGGHTEPTYVVGSDPVRSRQQAEGLAGLSIDNPVDKPGHWAT